jgi:hypothetical protein
VDGFIHRFILAIGEDPEKFKAFVNAAEAKKKEHERHLLPVLPAHEK